jgi:quinol monooxygenase YgiN
MRIPLLLAAALMLALACPVLAQDDKEPDIITKLKKAKVTGPFTLAVVFKVKEGKEKDLVKAARPCIAATRKEKGCITYKLQQELGNPQRFIFYEEWKSVDALAEHLKTEHVKKLRAALAELLDGEPQFHAFRNTDKE